MTSSKLADFGLSECSTSIVLRQPCFKSATHVLKIINEGADSPCVASSSVLISDGNKPFKKKKKKILSQLVLQFSPYSNTREEHFKTAQYKNNQTQML